MENSNGLDHCLPVIIIAGIIIIALLVAITYLLVSRQPKERDNKKSDVKKTKKK